MTRIWLLSIFVYVLVNVPCAALDLSKAVVVFPSDLSSTETKAVTMLVEEVEQRTQIHLPSSSEWPTSAKAVIAIGPAKALNSFAGPYAQELATDPGVQGAEGYRIRIKNRPDALPCSSSATMFAV